MDHPDKRAPRDLLAFRNNLLRQLCLVMTCESPWLEEDICFKDLALLIRLSVSFSELIELLVGRVSFVGGIFELKSDTQ